MSHRAIPKDIVCSQPFPSLANHAIYSALVEGAGLSQSNSDRQSNAHSSQSNVDPARVDISHAELSQSNAEPSQSNAEPPRYLERTVTPSLKPKPTVEDFGIKVLVSPDEPIVDIVAIHGLDGHREETWMNEDGTLWLRDFLPSDLPNARVLTYGYNANTGSEDCISTEIMRRDAQKFVQALVRKRRDAPRRPIIFIAHNLGGIILKWALVLSDNHRPGPGPRDDLRSILVSTQALLFFGTPHFGIKEDIINGIRHLASVYEYQTDTILEQLREDSSELENVQELYAGISRNIHRVCFYEAISRRKKGETVEKREKGVVSVSYSSAVLAGDPDARKESLYASHKEMVKLKRNQESYETVCDYIQQFSMSAVQEVEAKWAVEDSIRSAVRGC